MARRHGRRPLGEARAGSAEATAPVEGLADVCWVHDAQRKSGPTGAPVFARERQEMRIDRRAFFAGLGAVVTARPDRVVSTFQPWRNWWRHLYFRPVRGNIGKGQTAMLDSVTDALRYGAGYMRVKPGPIVDRVRFMKIYARAERLGRKK